MDSLVVQRCARELQALAGRLDIAAVSDIQAALHRTLECIPAELGPLALWTIRSLLVSAIQRVQVQLDPRYRPEPAFVQRLWHAPSAVDLIREARQCVGLLYEPVSRSCGRLEPGSNIERAVAYIQLHSNRPSLTLDDAAEHVKLSRWHLSRLLVRATGLRYRELVMNCRMERALALLHEGTLTIKELSAQLGYQYPTEFDRQFKHRFGVTPTHWRAMRQRSA